MIKINSKELEDINSIRHGFFTRKGGVSEGLYSSLNCGPGSSDKKENIEINRLRVKNTLGKDIKKLCTLYQIHSNKVVRVEYDFADRIQADAMVTDKKNMALGILTADCAPVLFADEKAGVIGAAHAGWKGAMAGILENTVKEMLKLGAEKNSIIVVIGPCIEKSSYEVGEEFYKKFIEENKENDKFFSPATKKEKFLFDLPAYALSKLKKFGLTKVFCLGVDTLQDKERFFSYRRSTLAGEKDYGRQISAIVIE